VCICPPDAAGGAGVATRRRWLKFWSEKMTIKNRAISRSCAMLVKYVKEGKKGVWGRKPTGGASLET